MGMIGGKGDGMGLKVDVEFGKRWYLECLSWTKPSWTVPIYRCWCRVVLIGVDLYGMMGLGFGAWERR